MERINQSDIIAVFIRFCNKLNKKCYVYPDSLKKYKKKNEYFPDIKNPGSPSEIGTWKINYAGCYGGWVINEVHNEHGGISNPLGMGRRTNREMFDRLHFAMDLLYLLEAQK